MVSSETDEISAFRYGNALTFLSWGVDCHVDWFTLFADIKNRGISMLQVCEIIEVPYSTLKDWKNKGVCPNFNKGLGLVFLWHAVTGKQPYELPLKPAANDDTNLKPHG